MSDEITPEEERAIKKTEWGLKYGRFWIIYTALIGTGLLSAFAGVALPFRPDESGNIVVNFGRIVAGIFYMVGFVSNGEAAAAFWFDKLTDHDKDNGFQKFIGGVMLFVSVATILVTSVAAGSFIAYFLGVLDSFQAVPYWAEQWVVFSIPVLWVVHFVFGVLFKTISDEEKNARDARSIISNAQLAITKAKADAKADYWRKNAPDIAKRIGEKEAEEEIQRMYKGASLSYNTYASDAEKEELKN